MDACVGGAPGYRPLAPGGSPQSMVEFDDWVQRTLLDPGRALYSRVEAEILLREDPRITHRTLYYDLLSAVAQGASTPAKIGGLLERQRSTVIAPLEVLESAGYVRREQDLLKTRSPVITVADPVIRFNQLITLPLVDMVEHGRARQAWQESRPTFHSKILGPHFEELARRWTRAFAPDETTIRAGVVGSTEVPDPSAKTKHEVDVLALAPGERPSRHTPGSPSSARRRRRFSRAACGTWTVSSASATCWRAWVTTSKTPPWCCAPSTVSLPTCSGPRLDAVTCCWSTYRRCTETDRYMGAGDPAEHLGGSLRRASRRAAASRGRPGCPPGPPPM